MDDTIKRSDAIKWFEPYANRGLKIPVETVIQNLKDIPSAEKQGEWISESIETYELPEGQIVVEYDDSGVGLISRECMEMLMDTLATNKPKQGEWISLHNGKWKCSECGIEVLIYAKGNFCPNCGARMKGADDEY